MKLATCGIVFLVTINMYMKNTFCNAACYPTTTRISSQPDQCDTLKVEYNGEDDGTCCGYQETQCNNGEIRYTLALCYFTRASIPCCEPFLEDDHKEKKSCFLVYENSRQLNQPGGSNIAFSICDSLASSSDSDRQKMDRSLDTTSAAGAPCATNLSLGQSSSITTPSTKNTHPTPPDHSNSLNLSPSTQQHNNPSSTAVIWGLIVGAVTILFVATILLLAAVSVIIAAKKSKYMYNAWIVCKESLFRSTHASWLST